MSNEHASVYLPTSYALRSLLVVLVVLAIFAASAWAKPGAVKNLGKKPWASLHDAVAFNGKMYVASGSTILAVDKTGKATEAYGDNGANFMTTLDGKLYVIAGTKLYVVEGKEFKEIDKGYKRNAGMVGLDGKLYILTDGALWEITKDGASNKLPGDWYHIGGMTALDGKIYIVKDTGPLFEVDTTGKSKQLEGNFEHAVGMTSANGKLYIVRNKDKPVLYEVETTGESTVLVADGLGKAAGATVNLAVLDGTLYAVVGDPNGTELFAVQTK